MKLKIEESPYLLEEEGVIGRAYRDGDICHILLQENLPKIVKKHVLLHEIEHCKRRGSEIGVITKSCLKDPIGCIKTIKFHLTHKTKKARNPFTIFKK